MTARPVVRKLSEFEWDKVILVSFVLAERLLDDYLDEGAKVARSVHESLRDHSHLDWKEYWPLGHHEENRRALEVDTAWAVQGYTSQHGVTHIQDCTTQLILAVCHLTKNSDPHEVLSKSLPYSFVLSSLHILVAVMSLHTRASPRHLFHRVFRRHGCTRHF